MPDPREIEPRPIAQPSGEGCASEAASQEVAALSERLRVLQSAWGMLAPSCLNSSGQEIVAQGRDMRGDLVALAKAAASSDPKRVRGVSERLDRLADLICGAAFEIQPPQFRSTLPGFLQSDRRRLLDLLDVLAHGAFTSSDTLASKLGILDYLVTLLCTSGDSASCVIAHDPAMLTPALQEICQRAEQECSEPLSDIESEFFSAAHLDDAAPNETVMRGLRARKVGLGRNYFVPGMLRAIVTYNVSLMQRVAEQVWDSSDWGGDSAPSENTYTPVFESEHLEPLRQAVLRRFLNGPPESTPIGRIAAALDFSYLNPAEKAILHQGSIDPVEPQATIVLVGLLCRSLNVLAIDLQDIGMDPDHVSDRWLKELEQVLQGLVNQSISGTAYQNACLLQELRNKFLHAPIVDVLRDERVAAPRRPSAPSKAAEERKLRKEARALATKAMAGEGSPHVPPRLDEDAPAWRTWPWQIIAPAFLSILVAAVFGLHQFGVIDVLGRNIDRWSGDELEFISPHLVRGHRTGDGTGIAFVGTLGEDWQTLPGPLQVVAAEELIDALREQGVVQVMIYDQDKQLRIQCLGDRVRVL
jgi:hypothetical protein